MIHPAQGVQRAITQEYVQKLGDYSQKPPPKFEKKNWDKTEIEIIPIFFTVCLVDQETIDVVK